MYGPGPGGFLLGPVERVQNLSACTDTLRWPYGLNHTRRQMLCDFIVGDERWTTGWEIEHDVA